jgi:hypothetical protein
MTLVTFQMANIRRRGSDSMGDFPLRQAQPTALFVNRPAEIPHV